MASNVSYHNVIAIKTKFNAEITQRELKEGRLNARSLINQFQHGMTIDVLVLDRFDGFHLYKDFGYSFNESIVYARRVFHSLSQSSINSGKLPVGVEFFKDVEEDCMVLVILHGDKKED